MSTRDARNKQATKSIILSRLALKDPIGLKFCTQASSKCVLIVLISSVSSFFSSCSLHSACHAEWCPYLHFSTCSMCVYHPVSHPFSNTFFVPSLLIKAYPFLSYNIFQTLSPLFTFFLSPCISCLAFVILKERPKLNFVSNESQIIMNQNALKMHYIALSSRVAVQTITF